MSAHTTDRRCTWIVAPPGSGKLHWARAEIARLAAGAPVYWRTGNSSSHSDYNGETVAVFSEFCIADGDANRRELINYTELLRLVGPRDHYVRTKRGMMQWDARTIIVVSEPHPAMRLPAGEIFFAAGAGRSSLRVEIVA